MVLAFLGAPRSENSDHAHEVGTVMQFPLIVLAFFAIIAGFSPVADLLQAVRPHHEGHDFPWFVFFVSVMTMLFGVGCAFIRYFNQKEEPKVIPLFANKFYFDEIYAWIVKKVQDGVAWLVRGLDALFIDGLAVGGLARITEGVGYLLRRTITGNLQTYSYLFGCGVFVVIYFIVFFE